MTTPAELKSTVEALGITRALVYERVGIAMQNFYRYISPDRTADVPEHVATTIQDLATDAEAAADRIATEYLSDPTAEALYRYVDLESFHAAVPELDGWPLSAQGPLLIEVQRRIDRPTRIEWA